MKVVFEVERRMRGGGGCRRDETTSFQRRSEGHGGIVMCKREQEAWLVEGPMHDQRSWTKNLVKASRCGK